MTTRFTHYTRSMSALRRRIFSIVDTPDEHDRLGHWFGTFIMALILFNIFAMVIQSLPELGEHEEAKAWFHYFEVFSVVVFTIEYVLRVWACVENPTYKRPILGRLAFMVSFMALVDLLAIAPFYLELFMGGALDLRFVRVLRLFRLFRLFKLGRYTDAFGSFRNVLVGRREELFISLFTVLMLLVFTASIMHVIEPDYFTSIPLAMWYCVVTLTTVGYGDMVPQTPEGKFVASFIALLGIGMIAIPAGILGGGFTEEIARRKREREERAAKKAQPASDTPPEPAVYAPGGGVGLAQQMAQKFSRIIVSAQGVPTLADSTVSVATVVSMTADGFGRDAIAKALNVPSDDVAQALRFAAELTAGTRA